MRLTQSSRMAASASVAQPRARRSMRATARTASPGASSAAEPTCHQSFAALSGNDLLAGMRRASRCGMRAERAARRRRQADLRSSTMTTLANREKAMSEK